MSQPTWLDKLEARRDWAYPAIVAVFAALVIFPLIGSFGLWDPQEFPIADLAKQVAGSGDYAAISAKRPPLTVWLAAFGIENLGTSELGARLPQALLAFLGVLATYGIGRRLRGPRAGLFAGLVLAATPLYFFQARQLTSDAGALAGSAFFVYGLIGLAWPEAGRKPRQLVLDAVALVSGLVLLHLGLGLVLGVGVPLSALALASSAAAGAHFSEAKGRQTVVAIVAGVVSLGIFFLWWNGRDTAGYQSLLGGAFRAAEAPATATFDYLVRQVAFGMYPWTALAPVAMLRLALVSRGDRAAWGGLLVLAWATVAYVAGTLWMQEMGDLRYPAVVAVALAVGFFIDDLVAARAGDNERLPGARLGLPLLALLVLCIGYQIGHDAREFPEELASVHLLQTIKWPAVLGITRPLMALGYLAALLFALAVGLGQREPKPKEAAHEQFLRLLSSYTLPAAGGLAVLLALGLSLVYTPRLSEHFSYKNVFDAYFQRRQAGEPLGVMGIGGSGPDFYSKGQLTRLEGLDALGDLLAQPTRTFAVAPASDLCQVQQLATARNVAYHVPYAANSRFFLYSNQLGAGDEDQNPLGRMIQRTPPSPRVPLSAVYGPATPGQRGQIELIGMDIPEQVSVRKKFKMTLYYKVIEKLSTNYQVFVHFDKGARFQGDHWPLDNLCGSSYWQPGDYVIDTFEVTAGDTFTTRGSYDIYTGLFTGGAGNWRNMTVVKGGADQNNRVKVGQVQVR